MGSKEDKAPGEDVTCGDCGTGICTGCKEQAHPGEKCGEGRAMAAFVLLMEEMRWRACPNCKVIVEKTEGCVHMVCRCRQEFCYACGVAWRPRTCSC